MMESSSRPYEKILFIEFIETMEATLSMEMREKAFQAEKAYMNIIVQYKVPL